MADISGYVENIKQYSGNVNEAAVQGIVSHLGIALANKDSSLVSASDPVELGRIRDGFLSKKLGRDESDEDLDKAIAAVVGKMSGERNKSRVTVYYLLAEHYGQLGDFVKS